MGGIQVASNPDEAEQAASQLLDSLIQGFNVQSALVEPKLEITRESHAGIIVDDWCKVRAPAVHLSTEGGTDTEEVARQAPVRLDRVFDGWQVTGVPVMTIVRGTVIMQDGEITGPPGYGQFVSPRQV